MTRHPFCPENEGEFSHWLERVLSERSPGMCAHDEVASVTESKGGLILELANGAHFRLLIEQTQPKSREYEPWWHKAGAKP